MWLRGKMAQTNLYFTISKYEGVDEMNLNMDNIVWNETEYKLKFVIDNPNFDLPQIVRVVQGHMVDEDDAIASGQVLTLHEKRKIETFIGTDGYGKEVSIPYNCPYPVKLVNIGNARIFTSVNEICFCEHPPLFVRLIEDLQTGDGLFVESNTTLEILSHILSPEGDVIGINCQTDSALAREITLPLNLRVKFHETITTELTNKNYLLSEIFQQHHLPYQVQFLPITERNCGYGPQMGDINLSKKLSTNCILATSIIDGVKHALTFSADLPITIQVAKGIINNTPTFEGITQVDMRKFDHFSAASPYTPSTIRDSIYDELKTPLLPRREFKPSRQNSSYRSCSSRYTGSLNELPHTHSQSHTSIVSTKSEPKKTLENGNKKRNKSLDFGKDIEKFVKSKFGFKNFKKSKLKDKNIRSSSFDIDFDAQSTRTCMTTTSDGASSIDVRSNGSDSTCNSSFTRIAECMDAMSLDQSIPPLPGKRYSRTGSSDSGIGLSGRKHNRSRSRSRSRLTPDAPSSNPSDTTCDNLSEWSLPVHIKDSSEPASSPRMKTSASFLWSADETKDDEIISNAPTSGDYQHNQDFLYNNNNNNNNALDTSNREAQNEISGSPLTTAQMNSMEEIRKMNEEGVAKMLDVLKLEKFKGMFQENQINGELLLDLEQDDLVNELKLSLFESKKIMKYIKGWRPESKTQQHKETSRRNSLNPRDWSEHDVYIHMTTINLPDLARFCQLNQVNGDLLLDILDKETLLSLKNDHNVSMSSFESKKLLNFVVKGWRPDSSPKKSHAT